MGIPIDEMLMELRIKLEAFEANPGHDTFAEIQHETRRIEYACEDEIEDLD